MTDHWYPQSEADLQAAIDADLLRETHYVDCKQEVTAKADSKETARDLASFAIDGGAVLVGVAEDKQKRAFSLSPQPLEGLAEKIENIAAMAIDPPLHVIPYEIESTADRSKGYIFVEVRPSVHAPHMVDGVYYGRGEKTRVRLNDAQVVRLHSQRQAKDVKILHLLAAEAARDPIAEMVRETRHLYLVAIPLSASPKVARLLARTENSQRFRQILKAGETRLKHRPVCTVPPAVDEAARVLPRARGLAMTSPSTTGPGRTLVIGGYKPEERMLDIEFREDGSIAVIMGRATIPDARRHNPPIQLILDELIAAYVIRLTAWAASFSDLMHYRGQWGFGIRVDGIRGLMSYVASENFYDGPTFDAESYEEVTTATRADLDDQWWVVTDQLVGRLAHALQTSHRLEGLITAPDSQ